MLRIAAKTSVERCGKQVAQSIRHETTQAAGAAGGPGKSGGSGIGKLLGVTAGLTTAAVGGTVGYAYYDPEFRKTVEETVPQSKELFNAVLGPSKNGVVAHKELKGKIQDILPNKVVQPLSPAAAPPKPTPIVPRPERSVERKPEKKPVDIVPVDVKKSPIPEAPKPLPLPQEVDRARKDLEVRLVSAIELAEKKVVAAKNSKLKTLQAIDEHSKALKKAVDDGQNANWDAVREALEKSEKLAKVDMADEAESRSKLDGLRKVITEGKNNENTTDLPLLLNASETANKFNYQLDELNQLVQKARTESRVLNQYKDLIEQSRRQFAAELNAVLPDVDLKAKQGKLSEDDLNALITHAHLRVDQLKRQLTDQQIREEQHIARAIEEQRKADSFLAKEQLDLELRRLRDFKEIDVEKKVHEQRGLWERELEQRLRQAAAAHQDHLEQVIRTQKQLHDIEQAHALEEAVGKERALHNRQVELALAKLGGIETALESRVAQDAENRRAKQYWIACQNLVESIVYGSKAGTTVDARRKPLTKELAVIKEACENDSFVQAVINLFPKASLEVGPYTEQDLKNRFSQVYKLGRRTAKIDDNGGSLWKYVSSYVQSFFMLELPRRFSADEKIDVNSADNYELLSRSKYFVDNGDYDNAIRVAQLLRGEPGRIARDWIADTRTYLETRWLAELLVAHAAVTSIRSIY